jgi:hypothetical protein
MPNHITNRVCFIGKKETVNKLLETICNTERGNECVIDFNKIIPMPEELRHVTSPPRIVSKKEYEKEMIEYECRRSNPTKEDKMIGITHSITQEMRDDYIKRFGASDWYDWSRNNWGTKWNAYTQSNVEIIDTNSGCVEARISFQTAWFCPLPVIEELSKQFLDVHIEIKWADEDFGSNVGKIVIYCGMTEIFYTPNDKSKEAYELAFEVLPEYKKEYEFKDGSYVYINNED